MSLTEKFPSVDLSHKPTPLELLKNVSAEFDTNVWIKRDDCTGLAFGGNKSRQLEFYIGQALQQLGCHLSLFPLQIWKRWRTPVRIW